MLQQSHCMQLNVDEIKLYKTVTDRAACDRIAVNHSSRYDLTAEQKCTEAKNRNCYSCLPSAIILYGE